MFPYGYIVTKLRSEESKSKKYIKSASVLGDKAQFVLGNLQDKVLARGDSKVSEYTTLQLIDDLMSEMQKLSEELADIFPERLMKITGFGAKKLASYWNSEEQTSRSRIRKIKQNPDYLTNPMNYEAFNSLRQNIKEKLGFEKSKKCLQIMDEYQQKLILGEIFVDRLFQELGRVSGDIKLTLEEAGVCLASSDVFVKNIMTTLNNPNNPSYNLNYKFSLERLKSMQNQLMKNFGENAKKCLNLLNKYEAINKDKLKEYSGQQYNLGNPHYFQNMDSNEKLYWFGFIEHDGYLVKSDARPYTFGLELSTKDRKHISQFASVLGLDLDKNDIKDQVVKRTYRGVLKEYKISIIQISCRPMFNELQELGFIGSKSDRKYVPQVVKDLVTKAKVEVYENRFDWKNTNSGKKALAWLYGAYDADGSLNIPAGKFRASSKSYLQEIKKLFGITGKVNTQVEPGELAKVFDNEYKSGGFYSLYIDVDIFREMILSYNKGLSRKLPLSSNLNGDILSRNFL